VSVRQDAKGRSPAVLYVCLLYHDPSVPPPEGIIERHFEFAREARQLGAYVASEALGDTSTATTVRVRGGQRQATDGPFAETKEVLGGLYILDCKDLDDAMALAARIPTADSGSVEIRPLMDVPGWEYTLAGERAPFPAP
jgi:hypothetical protein